MEEGSVDPGTGLLKKGGDVRSVRLDDDEGDATTPSSVTLTPSSDMGFSALESSDVDTS